VAEGEIQVSDEGPGIPGEDLPQAFERFHLRGRTEHGSPDGAGLDLAIVRELSEAMGGGPRSRISMPRAPALRFGYRPDRYPFAIRFSRAG